MHQRWLIISVCSATGNANLTEPEGGWDFTALQTIFSQRVLVSPTAATTAPASTTTSVSPSTSDHKPSPNKPKSYTGTIAGGVAAGIIVLIAAILYHRARASKAKRQQSTDQKRDGGTRIRSPKETPVQVFELFSEPPELEPGNRFELSGNPVRLSISRFELAEK